MLKLNAVLVGVALACGMVSGAQAGEYAGFGGIYHSLGARSAAAMVVERGEQHGAGWGAFVNLRLGATSVLEADDLNWRGMPFVGISGGVSHGIFRSKHLSGLLSAGLNYGPGYSNASSVAVVAEAGLRYKFDSGMYVAARTGLTAVLGQLTIGYER